MHVMFHARRPVSFALLVKSAVGVGVSILALAGATAPLFGFELSTFAGTSIALLGAALGTILALNS